MICKNCGEQTIASGKFCHSCGQKSDTHRLTFKHFLMHDVVHGMFHMDRGLPITLKEIFIRPGGVARDYIMGKRKRYYNFFYLLLLIIGLYLFLLSFDKTNVVEKEVLDKNTVDFTAFFAKNRKLVIFSWIPLFTLAASVVFRRLKFSIIEMAIPATIAVIGASIFNVLLIGFHQIVGMNNLSEWVISILEVFQFIFTFSVFLFPLVTFLTLVKGYYSFLGKVWRMLVFYLISFILLFVFLLLLMFVAGGGQATSLTF